MQRFLVGLDVGSMTVKIVVRSSPAGEILFRDYRRHEGQQAATVLKVLHQAKRGPPLVVGNCVPAHLLPPHYYVLLFLGYPVAMRIGLDVRTLSGHYTGDRTYWRGLVQGLAVVDVENEYFLYTRRPVEGDLPAVGPNFTWRVVPAPSNDALWMQQAFPSAARRDRIDVAHTQYNTPLFGMSCPIVTTVHDITFALFPEHFLPRDRFILNRFVPDSMRRAARVIAVSESTRRDILRRYKQLPPEKVVTTLLAPDSQFTPREQESARREVNSKYDLRDRPYILSVGVLQPRKNLALLLDAYALVRLGPARPSHRLVIVGKRGWKNEELDSQLKDLPPEVVEGITFTGYVPDQDLPLLYSGADLLCYPSVYEGFGLPPLEAMACGCPVLCTRTSSLPEVVGDAGLLLPPNDSDAWANAIDKLLAEPLVRRRWADRGLERARGFLWDKTARATIEVYRAAASG
ncbi:MAG: glycosyltransferase [Capsulimonadaceae bacterium]